MRLLVLLLVAMPVVAQAPEPDHIVISEAERAKIVELIGQLQETNEKLSRALNHCRSANKV